MPFPVSPNPGDSYTDAYGTVWIYAGSVNGWYRQTVIPGNETSYTASLITTDKIIDNTIINADIASNAAIAGTKISPNFGSQNVTTTGTSTAASFIPTSSTAPTNGVYLPAANSVALSTGGTGRLFISSAGLVGIGTSSPSALLHVASTGAVESLISGGGTVGDTVLHIKGNANAYKFIVPNGASQYGMGLYDVGNAAYRLFVNSAGRVGIGSTSPGANLELGAVASANQSLRINSSGNNYIELSTNGSTGEHKITAGNSASGTAQLIFETSSGGVETERARITSSGQLLFGTSTGSHTLTVNGTSQIGASQQGTTSVGSVSSGVATTILTTSTPASGTKVIEVLVSAVAGAGNSVITARFLWQVNGQGGVNTRNVLRESITTSSDLNAGNRTYTNLTAAATTSGANEILQVTATHGGAIGFTSTLNVVYRTVLGSDYS